MARKVTVAAFEVWIAEESNVQLVLDRIVGGLTLQKTAVALKQPYTCLQGYFHSTPERLARYEAALAAYADYLQGEAKEIADTVKPDRDHVAKARLQVDVRQNQAKALNRERWGDRLQIEKSVTHGLDEALLGRAEELLRLPEKVVGGEVVGGEPPLPLPASRPPVEADA